MPTVQLNGGDIQWVIPLTTDLTVYTGYAAALVAATALSAANSNAPVRICQILETVTAASGNQLDQVNLPGSGRPLYVVHILTGQTLYYPLESARVAAYAKSNNNAGAPVYVASIEQIVTAP